MVDAKRTFAGAGARVKLLGGVFGRLGVMKLMHSIPARAAVTDDLLDALVAL